MQDILTEKEAQERWCPMYRGSPDGESPAVNAGLSGKNEEIRVGKCVASACMAWRLAHKDTADGSERGYCGAFGLPRFT